MIDAMASEHDCEDADRYEEAELSEVGIPAASVDESDFAPARHRRVNQAKARRLAVAH